MHQQPFGQRPADQGAPQMTAIARAHALMISESIEKGWIVRGIKLGLGFWIAGLIVAVISMLMWTFILAAFFSAVMRFYQSGQEVQANPAAGESVGELNYYR